MKNINLQAITNNKLKQLQGKFEKYEDLTEEWEEAHADHTPTRYRHSVLQNGQGVQFECVKCYMCGVMAHKEIGAVQKSPEKFTKEKKGIFKNTKVRVNRVVAGFHMLPGD